MPPQNTTPTGMPPVMPPVMTPPPVAQTPTPPVMTPPQMPPMMPQAPIAGATVAHAGHSGLIVTVIALLAISGGAVFGYPQYKQYLPQSIQAIFEGTSESPEIVIEKATKKLSEIKSGTVNAQIKFKTDAYESALGFGSEDPSQGDPIQKITASFETNSSFDVTDVSHPKSTVSFETKGNYGVDGKTNFEVLIETEATLETVFVKLAKINLPFAPIDTSFLENQWISIPSAIQKDLVSVNGFPEISKEDEVEIRNILQNAQVLKIEKDLGGETVDGVASYHYSVSFDKAGIYTAGIKLAEFAAKKDNLVLTEEDKAKLKKEIDEKLTEPFEIWISKSDYTITKMSIAGSFSNEGYETAKNGKLVTVFYEIIGKYKPLTSPLVFGDHKDAKDIQVVIQEAVQKFLGSEALQMTQ